MEQTKMVRRMWLMGWSVYMLLCLLIFFFADYRNQAYTTAWWIVLISLSGAIITGIIYICYAYLLLHINNTENDNG